MTSWVRLELQCYVPKIRLSLCFHDGFSQKKITVAGIFIERSEDANHREVCVFWGFFLLFTDQSICSILVSDDLSKVFDLDVLPIIELHFPVPRRRCFYHQGQVCTLSTSTSTSGAL